MKRSWRVPLAGFVAGGLVGMTLLTVNVVGAAFGKPGAEADPLAADRALDVLHTPALLVGRGEPVELAYEIVCPLAGPEPGSPCSPKGTLHVRAVGEASFTEVPLAPGPGRRFTYAVPARLTADEGFEYYVEFEEGRGHSVTVPAAGSAAPEHAWTVDRWTTVDLGTHAFGSTRSPDKVFAQAGWGREGTSLGLSHGREQSRIGPSAYDVAPDGTVVVLDQANRRLALYRNSRVTHLPVEFVGAEGDLAVAPDGMIWVLDDGGTRSPNPIVLAYDQAGRLVARTGLAEKIGDMLRAGPGGATVHAYPSEMWLPVGRGHDALTTAEQARGANAGRPVAGGRELVVRASPDEARFALVAGDDVVAAWRVRSTTNLGEVQLAEPSGDGLTAIVRVWTENRAEFRVLRLGPSGLTGAFDVQPGEWAESAPLSRFRLHGDTLYHLRTGTEGTEVVAYRMGGAK